MKKISLITAFIFASIISNQANAQNSATGSAEASVTLITPISIQKDTDMSFGTFVSSAVPGTITMTPAGAVSAAGGVTQISGGTISAAAFTVSGETDQTYAITLPGAVSLTGTVEGDILSLDNFTSTPENSGVIGTDATVSVGGTLTVPANSKAGLYTGSFDVVVNYN